LDLCLQSNSKFLLHAPLNRRNQRANFALAGPAIVDDEVGVLLADAGTATAQVLEARHVNQLSGTGLALEMADGVGSGIAKNAASAWHAIGLASQFRLGNLRGFGGQSCGLARNQAELH